MIGMGEAISGMFTIFFIVLVLAIGSCTYSVYTSTDSGDVIPEIGISIDEIANLKKECEQSLPRNQECVMVYEFSPVNKEPQNDPT